MNLTVLGFDWDTGNRNKCRKHGLDLLEIEGFFKQEALYVAPALDPSQQETRYLAVGRSPNGKPMLVVFAFREKAGERLIRPISARYMHKKEAQRYEEESSET
ncbi:BrnT family toxin [Nitrospina watsonii]|uniref:BrnT family toxin n=1 Tax=Nitrospina watsonii TaxID=1323948 RepID=A0ABM9HAC5_9BACT|nr:BrnT family toxin [Nitrospina watsonii]CAI2717055.1 conserved protein of unknown function [Nitrospina watsonii]